MEFPSADAESFPPIHRFRKLGVHKVRLRFPNLDSTKNLTPSTLVNSIRGSPFDRSDSVVKRGEHHADGPLYFPALHALCQRGDAVSFLAGLQIPHLAAAVDRPGPRGKEARPCHHGRADRRAGGPPRRHQLRRGRGPRARGAPRRDEPRLRLRPAVPEGGGYHPPRRDVLLRRRQHGPHHPARGRAARGEEGRAGRAEPLRLCRPLEGHALPRLHPSAARPAHDRGQARGAVDQRAAHGHR